MARGTVDETMDESLFPAQQSKLREGEDHTHYHSPPRQQRRDFIPHTFHERFWND